MNEKINEICAFNDCSIIATKTFYYRSDGCKNIRLCEEHYKLATFISEIQPQRKEFEKEKIYMYGL